MTLLFTALLYTALTQSLPWQTLNLLILQQPTHQRFPRLRLDVIIESVHQVLRGFISALLGRSVVWNESSDDEQHNDVFYTWGNKLYSKKWTAYCSVGALSAAGHIRPQLSEKSMQITSLAPHLCQATASWASYFFLSVCVCDLYFLFKCSALSSAMTVCL